MKPSKPQMRPASHKTATDKKQRAVAMALSRSMGAKK